MIENSITELSNTGERLLPDETDCRTYWEHISRYDFAAQRVKGKLVLDIASGEGYGTYALQAIGKARGVVGIDCSPIACQHAAEKYGLNYLCADATAIPLADSSLDVIVSFETIEHVRFPDAFIAECVRLLIGNGVLIISTPNKEVYNLERDPNNSYHCSEMTESEFVSVVGKYFKTIDLYGQVPSHSRWWQWHSLRTKGSIWTKNPFTSRVLQQFMSAQLRSDLQSGEQRPISRNPFADIGRANYTWRNVANPFGLYRRSYNKDDRPCYFVAVCHL